MHGDGSAKVSRKEFFSREIGHFGNKEFRTTPKNIRKFKYVKLCKELYVKLGISLMFKMFLIFNIDF